MKKKGGVGVPIFKHGCRMLLRTWEPISLRRRQDDQNTLKFDQKQHFYATILARRRQIGPRRPQTLKAGLVINLPPSLSSSGMLSTPTASGHSRSTRQQYKITLPRTQRKIQYISRFLGLLNFFRSFLPNATLLLQPLTSLMKKSAVFVWENKAYL